MKTPKHINIYDGYERPWVFKVSRKQKKTVFKRLWETSESDGYEGLWVTILVIIISYFVFNLSFQIHFL